MEMNWREKKVKFGTPLEDKKAEFPKDIFYTTMHTKAIAKNDINDFPHLKYLNNSLYAKLVVLTLKVLRINSTPEEDEDEENSEKQKDKRNNSNK